MSVFIIAEAGVNHNGDLSNAFKLIDAAYDAGANAVKFQIFKSENLVTDKVLKANYQQINQSSLDSQFSMLKKLEMPFRNFKKLKLYSDKKGIQFLSTAFDDESLDYLINNISVQKLKISSGDLTNAPLLLKSAQSKKNIILSTGMSNLSEIRQSLSVIAFGLISSKKPSINGFKEAFNSELGQNALKQKVTLLHCTSEYPAPYAEINLNAITTIMDKFKIPVGYSDHTEGVAASIAAVTLGAKIIEKHFTLDRSMEGPDHKASLEPDELKKFVEVVRITETSLGSFIKEAQPSEKKNIEFSRRFIVAAKDIIVGDEFTEENLTVKRAGKGINPINYWELIGKKSNKSYKMNDLIHFKV